jgi:formylmethanofuran dehydrogenase subunit E
MHDHQGCRYMHLRKDYSIEDLAAFHGHLGPYIVLGYRIGKYIRNTFCDDPFQMSVRVHCSGVPPQSCIIDGIQLSSGCTLGKRNIEIIESDDLWCEFVSDGRSMKIVPVPFATPERDAEYQMKIEKIAEAMYALPDADLFSASAV